MPLSIRSTLSSWAKFCAQCIFKISLSSNGFKWYLDLVVFLDITSIINDITLLKVKRCYVKTQLNGYCEQLIGSKPKIMTIKNFLKRTQSQLPFPQLIVKLEVNERIQKSKTLPRNFQIMAIVYQYTIICKYSFFISYYLISFCLTFNYK